MPFMLPRLQLFDQLYVENKLNVKIYYNRKYFLNSNDILQSYCC